MLAFQLLGAYRRPRSCGCCRSSARWPGRRPPRPRPARSRTGRRPALRSRRPGCSGRRHEVDVGPVEHQLDAHEHADGVALGGHADDAADEQQRAEQQVVVQADRSLMTGLLAGAWPGPGRRRRSARPAGAPRRFQTAAGSRSSPLRGRCRPAGRAGRHVGHGRVERSTVRGVAGLAHAGSRRSGRRGHGCSGMRPRLDGAGRRGHVLRGRRPTSTRPADDAPARRRAAGRRRRRWPTRPAPVFMVMNGPWAVSMTPKTTSTRVPPT